MKYYSAKFVVAAQRRTSEGVSTQIPSFILEVWSADAERIAEQIVGPDLVPGSLSVIELERFGSLAVDDEQTMTEGNCDRASTLSDEGGPIEFH